MSRRVRDVESLPHQQSMRAGLRIRKMRVAEHRHIRIVRTQRPKGAQAS